MNSIVYRQLLTVWPTQESENLTKSSVQSFNVIVFQINSMLSLKNTYQQSAPLLIDQSVSRKKEKKMQPLKFSN